MTFDVLLRGADVLDGTGAPAQRLDVGLVGDTITYLGAPLDARHTARTIEMAGLVLAPGFVDIHTHSDVSLLHDPAGESKVRQGVTTEVVGNCGFSAFPCAGPRRTELLDHLARLGDRPVDVQWTDLEGYARTVEQDPPALNVAALAGHGALRIAAAPDPWGPPTAAGTRRMVQLLDEALGQGAFGVSTGLTHTPSSIGDDAEIEALVAVCARHDALYATHARAGAGHELAAIDEAITCAGRTGARLQYSHLALNEPGNRGRATDALARFHAAAASGLDVAFDVYPYDASSSALVQYLPEWVQAGGGPAIHEHNARPAWRSRALDDIRGGWFGGIPWHWDRIVISAAGEHADIVGSSLAQISELRGVPPEDVLLDLCAELGSAVQAVLHYRTEADMTSFLADPLSIVGSDGSAVPMSGSEDRPHPRGFGTFPRVLGRYVRDSPVLGLADAVHKMTASPARRLGLARRGELRVGNIADLAAFDPHTITDRATFGNPRQAPIGVRWVLVSGEIVLEDGLMTGARPGRFLRHG